MEQAEFSCFKQAVTTTKQNILSSQECAVQNTHAHKYTKCIIVHLLTVVRTVFIYGLPDATHEIHGLCNPPLLQKQRET